MVYKFFYLLFLSSCYLSYTKPDIYFSGALKNNMVPDCVALSSDALVLAKENKLTAYFKDEYKRFKDRLKLFPTFHEKQELKRLEEIYNLVTIIEPIILWHQKVPTTGLLSDNKKLTYPFLPHAFSLHQLAPKRGQGIMVVLLDYPLPEKTIINDHNNSKKLRPKVTRSACIKSHSLHNAATIAGIDGIAPCARTEVISLFDKNFKSWPSNLIAGLKQSITMNADIVNVSIKLTDYLDPLSDNAHLIQIYLNLIPYTVAASGNSEYINRTDNKALPVEAYPGRFDAVAFDVGSFGYDQVTSTYPVSNFSQYEKFIGPKFLAPGEYIVSTGLIENQPENDFNILMSGTSMAAPIMSGFVALMLAEFKSDFSREELLTACYYSTLRMHATPDWQQKSLLGVLDMRLVLFTLHCICALKRTLKDDVHLNTFSFKQLLVLVHEQLLSMVNLYSKRFLSGISFKESFGDYYNACQKKVFKMPDYFNDLDTAINKIVLLVIKELRNHKPLIAANLEPLLDKIDRVFTVSRQSSTLFVTNLKSYFSNRFFIKSEIDDLIKKTEPLRDYWKTQLNWSKRRSW